MHLYFRTRIHSLFAISIACKKMRTHSRTLLNTFIHTLFVTHTYCSSSPMYCAMIITHTHTHILAHSLTQHTLILTQHSCSQTFTCTHCSPFPTAIDYHRVVDAVLHDFSDKLEVICEDHQDGDSFDVKFSVSAVGVNLAIPVEKSIICLLSVSVHLSTVFSQC